MNKRKREEKFTSKCSAIGCPVLEVSPPSIEMVKSEDAISCGPGIEARSMR
jgi:hypothetical protein